MTDQPQGDEMSTLAGLPLDSLCQEVLERHHAYAHVAVPRIRGRLAALLEREPGALAPDLPTAFGDLAELLVGHLAKEENILFPALAAMADAERAGGGRPPLPFATLLHPIRLMEAEHVRLASALGVLTALAGDFVAPEGASDATRRLMSELAIFRDQLVAHLQVENELLFPRALDLDRRL
jgi:regulator of cell morphogenesis and NO signaling